MYGTRRMPRESLRTPFRFHNLQRVCLLMPRASRHKNTRERPSNNDAVFPAERHNTHLTEYEKSEIQSYSDVYYAGENCERKILAPVEGGHNSGYDDERGDYLIRLRDHLGYRYEILDILGSGSFGQVVKAIDHLKGTTIAVKIIRNKKRFTSQAKVEVQILAHLRKNDPNGTYGVVQMLDSFVFRSHTCITYELLSINLYEYLKKRSYYPLSQNVVRRIGAGVLISLSYIWRENIIHCDLKPENILFEDLDRVTVKVIDFGSSCFENARLYTYIQSRFYRAPEVILGCPYSKHIDLWSYGCVLCELATGVPIFPGESEREQLACIMEYLGPPPLELISQSPRKNELFNASAGYAPKLVPNSKRKIRYPGSRSLASFLGLSDDDGFVSFVKQFLCWMPADRVPPRKAMQHAWIAEAFEVPSMPTLVTSKGQGKLAVRAAISNISGATGSSLNVPHLPKIGQ